MVTANWSMLDPEKANRPGEYRASKGSPERAVKTRRKRNGRVDIQTNLKHPASQQAVKLPLALRSASARVRVAMRNISALILLFTSAAKFMPSHPPPSTTS
jgi:hypothetical protein